LDGWVNDSTPENEFQETVNKSMAMRKAVAVADGFSTATWLHPLTEMLRRLALRNLSSHHGCRARKK
jgi:hypothetical protein